MEYYTLGKSGLKVSRLCLGTMTFGDDWGWGSEESAARAIFDAYVEAGGNFFDTADIYTNGQSERLLGKFVADAGLRDQAVIATKFSVNQHPGNPNAGGNGRKNIMRAVDASLERLGTDYIDLYYLHLWDRVTPPDEVIRTLDDLVRAGKILHYGLSDIPAWYASRAQTLAETRRYDPVAAMQLQYSLIERNIEGEYSDLAQRYGMGLVTWSPLASGLLSGKYKPGEGDEQPSGDGRLNNDAAKGNPGFDLFNDRNWAIVEALEDVAEDIDRSMAQVAINWVANRPGVASVIIGATKTHQIKDNLGALEFTLSDEQLGKLDAASRPDLGFPYDLMAADHQAMNTGGTTVGSKPASYARPEYIDATANSLGRND